MRAIKLLGVSVVAVALSASAAFAKVADQSKPDAASGTVSPLPKAATLADNVVVTPGTNAPAPAPAPAPTVNVQPVQPVEPAPVVVPPQRTVVTQESPHNYVATVAVSALLGGLLGALVGGSIYYLDTPRHDAGRIGYWAAGGVLVGTGVGIVNVFVDESRADRAVSTRFPTDPVPTFRAALVNTSF